MLSDIEISSNAKLQHIEKIAGVLGLTHDDIDFYGKYKAKILKAPDSKPKGKLVLVTAINPTPYGEGKTTVSIGLADGLKKIGKKSALALREPSLGPVFGVKGGAAGGGYAQVVPMEDINLHFTGDFHAITSANNLLSAMLDNHIKQGNALDLDIKRIEWKRCLDLNDRALREVTVALGGEINGTPRTDGFNITAASEIMAILCLSTDAQDLKRRLGNIVVGYNKAGGAVTCAELKAENAMAILLKDAICPNLVQTLEGTPAIIHGGPFANIAHGCNSILATKLAMSLADYTITEAGFGAELGAEKFFDIKCRVAGLAPSAVVIVATARSLKYNGGAPRENIQKEDLNALTAGLVNLKGHIDNIRGVFGITPIVAINRFYSDTDREIEAIIKYTEAQKAEAVVTEGFAKGGEGAKQLAEAVVKAAAKGAPSLHTAYDLNMSIEEKVKAVATKIYGAKDVTYSDVAMEKIKKLKKEYTKFPICIAKTQYSFSPDAKLLGRPTGFDFYVRDISLRAGSEFIVIIAGDIMLMPGLPAVPAACKMTIDSKGKIEGLF